MNNQSLIETTVVSAKKLYKGSYLDNDLIIFDSFKDVPFPREPRRMKSLFLALCTKGYAEYTVDTVHHTLQPNSIMIISEDQVTDNYVVSEDCDGMAMMISYEFFNEIIKGVHELSSLFLFSRNHPVCALKPSEVETTINYVKLIKQKVDNLEHHFRRETVQSMLTTMIYDLSNVIYRMQNSGGKKMNRAEITFVTFIKLVEQNFRKERRVGWYGLQMNISPKYLSETIKQVSHRTPNEWIDNYVTLEIRVLLKNSTKSIKEIASDMNFPNQSFFGKYFKEHVGMSPLEYRRS